MMPVNQRPGQQADYGTPIITASAGVAFVRTDVHPSTETQPAYDAARAAVAACDAKVTTFRTRLLDLSLQVNNLQQSRAKILLAAAMAEARGDGNAANATIKQLTELSAKIEILTEAAMLIAELLLPESIGALDNAKAVFFFAGRDLGESKRAESLKEHMATLQTLADQQGSVEIRPQRWEQEGLECRELERNGQRHRAAAASFLSAKQASMAAVRARLKAAGIQEIE